LELRDWIFLAVSIAQLVVGVLALKSGSQTQPKRPVLIVGLLMLLTWAAVGWDYFSRPEVPEAQILRYDSKGQQFHAVVLLRKWQDYKNDNGMLITRTIFVDRDRMTDDWIAKSIAYTIDGQTLNMIAVTNNQMRFKTGETNFIEFNFVVIPSDKRPEQVRTLSDVSRLGGEILTMEVQGIPE
jgi:hypothetical protein